VQNAVIFNQEGSDVCVAAVKLDERFSKIYDRVEDAFAKLSKNNLPNRKERRKKKNQQQQTK